MKFDGVKLGGFGSERWSSQAFVESRVTSLRTRTTSTALVSRLMLLGADATKAVVPTGVIVDDIVGVGDVRQRDVTARMDRCLMRSYVQHGSRRARTSAMISGRSSRTRATLQRAWSA